jgi:hypothetical protein
MWTQAYSRTLKERHGASAHRRFDAVDVNVYRIGGSDVLFSGTTKGTLGSV